MTRISIKSALLLLSFALMAGCGKSPEKQILGRWYFESTYEIPQSSPSRKVSRREVSVSEYFPNGGSVLNRRVFFRQENTDQNGAPRLIETATDIVISREWMIKDDKVISKIIDVKTTPIYLKRDGVLASDADMKAFFGGFKKPEDVIPKGQTVQVKIIALDKDKYVFEADLDGRIETFNATKTEKSFRELAR